VVGAARAWNVRTPSARGAAVAESRANGPVSRNATTGSKHATATAAMATRITLSSSACLRARASSTAPPCACTRLGSGRYRTIERELSVSTGSLLMKAGVGVSRTGQVQSWLVRDAVDLPFTPTKTLAALCSNRIEGSTSRRVGLALWHADVRGVAEVQSVNVGLFEACTAALPLLLTDVQTRATLTL
jgi:hypothetical protein